MATATVEFDCPDGLTLTVELYSLSTDTLVSSTAATERTNDKGSYTASVIDKASATYKIRIHNAANNTIARGILIHTNDTVSERPILEANVLAISAAGANKIADHVRRRTQANVEASSDGDTLSVDSHYGAIQMQLEASITNTTVTIYKTDGTTVLGTKTVVLDANALPIKGVN